MYTPKDITYHGGSYATRDHKFYIHRADSQGYSYWYDAAGQLVGSMAYSYLFVTGNPTNEDFQVWVDKLNKEL